MPGPGGRDFQQSYNCQAVVDSAHQVIVAARATNQPSDKQQAVVMVEETIGNVGAVPKEVSAAAGYYSAKAVDGLYDLGVDPLIAPEKTRHGRGRPAPRGPYPRSSHPGTECAASCGPAGSASPADGTVEPVLKQGRGFRQFLLRGLAKVTEWLLICTGHNPEASARGREAWRPRPQDPPATGIGTGLQPAGYSANASVHLSAPHKNRCRRLVPTQSLPVSYSSDGLLGIYSE